MTLWRWPEITGAVVADTHYGPDEQQVLDICAQGGSAAMSRPALIMIHGGSWRSGGKKDWREVCRRAAETGLVGIAIDYRLADGSAGHSWPAQLVDAQLALRWVRSHAADYNIDSNHICVIGDSAGGHLAVFLAALERIAPGDYAGQLADVSPQANCAIDWFGPVDMKGFLEQSPMMRQMFVGITPDHYAEAEHAASPLFAIGPHTAPILIGHGAKDIFVNITQSRALQTALNHSGVPNQLWIFRGGHEFVGAEDQRGVYADTALAFAKNPLGFLKNNHPPAAP